MNLHKKFITKDDTITLGQSLALLVVGLLLGTVFTFGVQYWNKTVTKEECIYIETQFLDYKEIKQRSRINQIAIDCADGERYFIEQVLINTDLKEAISDIENNDGITMLIHPTGGNILELTHNDKELLKFDESMEKLGKNAKTFAYLGLFMYLASLMGLVCAVLNISNNIKVKKKKAS
jgi:hypothetical protein